MGGTEISGLNIKRWFVVLSFCLFLSPLIANAVCTSPAGISGTIERFDADFTMKYCDGTNWKDITGEQGADSSACTNPNGSFGSRNYNSTKNKMLTCNGGKWVALRPTCQAKTLGVCTTAGETEWDITEISYKWCDGTNWIKADGAALGTLAIGDACDEVSSTVYAGISTDASASMYATPCDIGQTWDGSACSGTRTTHRWHAAAGVAVNVRPATLGDDDSGSTNTATLIVTDSDTATIGVQEHDAAQQCADLTYGGYTDWYLPSKNELNVLRTNRVAISNFVTTGYWSSTGTTGVNYAVAQNFNTGNQTADGVALGNKDNVYYIRCVRKGF